jgi:hypothetical protein
MGYSQSISSTCWWDTLKALVALVVQYKWRLSHLDVKTTFLKGKLKEEMYMVEPKGFEVLEQEKKVCKWLKSLYGLR